MRRRIEVATDTGLVVFRDAERQQPCPGDGAEAIRSALRAGAGDGAWFYLDADDPVRYRIELLVDEAPTGLPEHRFQRLGGTFKVRIESGRFVISAFEDWLSEHQPVVVPPGCYALEVRGPGAFDRQGYDREYRELLGEADWRYHERVDRLGIGGCLGTLCAAGLLVVPYTRRFWYLALTVLALGWAPNLLLRRAGRYRSIARRIAEHDQSLPHYVVRLTPADAAAPIAGGHLIVS